MVKKLGLVLIRGIITVVAIPMLYSVLKNFINGEMVTNLVAGQSDIFAFIVEIAFPVGYIIAALIWTFMPLFKVDKQPTNNIPTQYWRK